MIKVRQRCGYPNGIDVGARGRSGGLCLAWRNDCQVSLCSFSCRHIDVIISQDKDGKMWRCTGFYGAPEEHNRRESWNFLRYLDDSPNVPWLVIGDFNELLFSFEKSGGLLRSQRQMDAFRIALEDCSLSDIGYQGSWFTWEKGKFAGTNIRERLDRGVANEHWWSLFPSFTLSHMVNSLSDHCPLLLDTIPTAGVIPRWHFKFEAAWLIEDSCEPEVQKLWVESSGFLPDRLRYMSRGLDAWFRKLKASRKFTTKSLTKRLEQLTELLPSDNVLEEMMEVKLALNLEADKSELYWEQRSRANWLRYGDKNTAFFHRHASQRKRYNRICSIENENGQSCSSPDDMLHIAQEYFVSLFSSSDTADPSFILDGISHCVSDASNNFLLRPYSKVEFLPTRYCLYNRRIALDPICPVCNLANETTEHVFRDCHIACLVWTRLGFVWPQYATLLPFKEWLSWLFDSFPMNRLVLLVITLWSLWYARNKKVHEANLQTPEQISPDPPLVKANFDASFSSVDRASWSGVVVRNSIGEIMGACRRFSPYVASAFMAEAYAALHAIDLLVDLGFDSAVIEGDSLTIIKKLQASSSDLSELSAIIFEVQAKAKTLRNCSFNFTSRASNQVAHIIAKDFSLNSGDRFWVEEIPSSALRVAASDCRNLHPP
ncbi:hypothetical protein GQ457_18G000980 [Hibiscus cannabinus]